MKTTTGRCFQISESVKSGRQGYLVKFIEDDKICFSNFFLSEEVQNQGYSFDFGFEKACHVGQMFIGGGNGSDE